MDKLTTDPNDPDYQASTENSSVLSKILHLLWRTFLFGVGVLIGLVVDDPALPFTFKSKRKVSKQNLDVVIIGAGISGIAIAKVDRNSQWKCVLFMDLDNMFHQETE